MLVSSLDADAVGKEKEASGTCIVTAELNEPDTEYGSLIAGSFGLCRLVRRSEAGILIPLCQIIRKGEQNANEKMAAS